MRRSNDFAQNYIQNYTNSLKFNPPRNYPVNEHPNISENLSYAITQIISVSHYEIRSFTIGTRVHRIRGFICICIYTYKEFVCIERRRPMVALFADYHRRGWLIASSCGKGAPCRKLRQIYDRSKLIRASGSNRWNFIKVSRRPA